MGSLTPRQRGIGVLVIAVLVVVVVGWLVVRSGSDGGDSAGGGLSLATVLALRERGTELPDRVICLSPWTDLALKGNTHHTKQKSEVLLTTKVLHEWALCYAGPEDLENPFLSPINADLAGFPPLLIQVGSEEILLDDSIVLAEHAKAAGVQVECKTWPGMWHVWHALGNFIPESQEAFEEIRQFMG